MENNEDKIRDNLALNLEILEQDLSLIDKEAYLPNQKGTRGFVDILAQNSNNSFVLIEVKRTKASSREALHEVLKYIEGIKENKSLKNDEIQVIIISTEWKELLVPFSSFVAKVPYSVIGFELKIDEDFKPIEVTKIDPLQLNNERFLSDQHTIRLYSSKKKLKKGIESHKECYSRKGITDYVLLILEAPTDLREQGINQVKTFQENNFDEEAFSSEELESKFPDYKFMIYSSVQVMTKDEYLNIIKTDQAVYEEVKELMGQWEEENLIDHLHKNAISNCEPFPFGEYIEISYPAKLRQKLLENEGWEIIDLIRNGRLKDNELLTNSTIIDELKGDRGTNKQRYHKKIHTKNSPSFEHIKKELEACLVDNPIWATGITRAIDEIAKLSKEHTFSCSINVYNPSNTLLSIYQVATSSGINALKFIPNYRVRVEGAEIEKLYFGCLKRNDNALTLQDTINEAYDGNESYLLASLIWGGYQKNDIDICPLYGLEYANFKCEVRNSDKNYFLFDGYRYKTCEAVDPYSHFFNFLNERINFVDEVVNLFESNMLSTGIVEL